MPKPQIIHAESAGELVVLPRAEYDALLAAAGDLDAEARAVHRIVAAHQDALARGEEILLPDWLAFATARGETGLKVVRKHLKRTQQDVARAAGITQGFLSDLERGANKPTAEMRARLAVALDVDPRWLEE